MQMLPGLIKIAHISRLWAARVAKARVLDMNWRTELGIGIGACCYPDVCSSTVFAATLETEAA